MPDEPAPPSHPLDAIDVILVEPQGPRNVGSVARAMVNFGLSHLTLVKGPALDHQEVRMMAVKAEHVLARARRVETFEEAIADKTFIMGTTARRRERLPTVPPREGARKILDEAARGRVGILFGREDRGLKGSELRHAHEAIAIEVDPACRSLNISQALVIIAYEIFLAAESRTAMVADSDPGRMVTNAMAARLRAELSEALEILGIMHDGTRVAYHQSLERLFSAGPIQTRDARVLFALARRVKALEENLLPFRGVRTERDDASS